MRTHSSPSVWRSVWLACAACVALASITGCARTVPVAEGVPEDRMNQVRLALAIRSIPATVDRVDDALWDVSVDDAMSEHARYAVLDARLSDRPAKFGDVVPGTVAQRKQAREIEDALRAKPKVIAAHVVLLTSKPPASADANGALRPWAHVGMVYEPIDERGTAAVTVDQTQKLVAEAAGLKPADVVVEMRRHWPLDS